LFIYLSLFLFCKLNNSENPDSDNYAKHLQATLNKEQNLQNARQPANEHRRVLGARCLVIK
jgi:hypothetical protein